MDNKFKWNMFITSFIPLWLSIIISDIWSIVDSGIKNWLYTDNICHNLLKIYKMNWVSILVVLIIGVLMATVSGIKVIAVGHVQFFSLIVPAFYGYIDYGAYRAISKNAFGAESYRFYAGR